VLPSIPICGEWFRCVSLRRDPLSSEGARLTGGRLNVPGEPTIYLASTPTLAVAENLQLGSLFGVERFPPRLLVTIEVDLSRVVDLRSEPVRLSLGIAKEDLNGDWRSPLEASQSQLLGLSLADMEFEGALCPSAIEPGVVNLVVFVRNVDPAPALRIVGGD
jgi:RES domain-containing protein